MSSLEEVETPGTATTTHVALSHSKALVYLILESKRTLFDDDIPCLMIDGEHGVEDVRLLSLVQMREEDILGDGFGQRSHRRSVLRNNLRPSKEQTKENMMT